MGYVALSAFLSAPIATAEDIPEAEKTPEYWAVRLGREWCGLPADVLAEKLLPFFREFNRLCEGEKAQAARIHALETALAPFGRQYDEVVFDGMSDELLEEYKAFCFEPLKVADLRRARSVLSEKQS